METLPDDICSQIALLLHCPDVLSLASTNARFRDQIGRSKILFQLLFCRDTDKPLPRNLQEQDNEEISSSYSTESLHSLKRKYLAVAYSNTLASIRWCPTLRGPRARRPEAREGHLMTVLGTPHERVIVTTGGFSDDDSIYSLKLRPAPNAPRCWRPNTPVTGPPSFVYGASLTALDESRAVRFGGFRAGGYSAESNEVCLLTMILDENGTRSFRWEPRTTTGTPPTARAYHTATVLLDRYLVIVGGMTTRGSILQCAILDTRTWTWIDRAVSVCDDKPSGRHGHSIVLDERRNRLVLFGGGSGSDLLRSGVDNTEVWQLSLGCNWKTDLEGSLPWTWSKIYKDMHEEEDNNDNDDESDELDDPTEASEVALPDLSPSESLVLGRCHVGVRVTLDTVLLAFGSGRPSTNGVLGYDLRTDSFLRPSMNFFPTPRFSAASAVLENEGYVIVNGGYSTQEGGAVGDTIVLDLAPVLGREFSALEPAPDGDPTIDSQVHQVDPATDIDTWLARLVAVPQAEREVFAIQVLRDGISQGTLNRGQTILLSILANGLGRQPDFGQFEDRDEDSEENEEEEDSDYDMSLEL